MEADELTVEEFIAAIREEAKRANKLRREKKERDPYRESLRLKSCRKWLEKTFGTSCNANAGMSNGSQQMQQHLTVAHSPASAAVVVDSPSLAGAAAAVAEGGHDRGRRPNQNGT